MDLCIIKVLLFCSESNDPIPIAAPGDTYMASGYPDEMPEENQAMFVTSLRIPLIDLITIYRFSVYIYIYSKAFLYLIL